MQRPFVSHYKGAAAQRQGSCPLRGMSLSCLACAWRTWRCRAKRATFQCHRKHRSVLNSNKDDHPRSSLAASLSTIQQQFECSRRIVAGIFFDTGLKRTFLRIFAFLNPETMQITSFACIPVLIPVVTACFGVFNPVSCSFTSRVSGGIFTSLVLLLNEEPGKLNTNVWPSSPMAL